MSRAVPLALALAAAGLTIVLGLALGRVHALEVRELDAEGAPQRIAEASAPGSLRLLDVRLLRGDEVTLELCARDGMLAERWAGVGRIALVRRDRPEIMFELPIDARLLRAARRSRVEACVPFGHVDSLDLEGESVDAAIELRWDEPPTAIAGLPLRARALARRRLDERDLALVLAALCGALAAVLILAARAPKGAHDGAERGALRASIGVLAVLGCGTLLGSLGPVGPTVGLLGGLALALVEVAVAFWLVRPAQGDDRALALGLVRPARGGVALASMLGAPVVGLLLYGIASLALALVPSAGEAPVETFVRWPSGMLSFATLAVVAPIAEEVFFRGLVYGALRGPGGAGRQALAIGGAWLLFALAHLPQDWGNWGGMIAVLVAGLGLTVLRAVTGSTLVSCVAHLVYNGLLAASALVAGAS